MKKINLISLIKICAFTVFLGRAYQFYFFGAPFRAILWDESLLTPIVEGLSDYTWYDYATSESVNTWIDGFTRFCGIILFLGAITSLFWDNLKYHLFKKIILVLSLLILVILGICMVKDSNYDILKLFELSMQFAAPIILLLYGSNMNSKKVLLILKITTALTFIPHGLFAMGLIYLPGHFVDMTILIFGVNEAQATSFLFIVGLLDVICSFLIFIPGISKYVLIYMVFWGFATAFARVFAGFNQNFLWSSLHNNAYLTVYRLAHGFVPLIALLLEHNAKKEKIKITTP
ncbi:hypothetical protein [Winogradskyella ursingii]|uniref:hypothetical protein n=1 Tax=Winogradskyella ursingii TaxID=2686079 RepID=UPI0015CD12A4|nr:hypothetical protein [Winogradskyella ursingii]